MSNKVNSCSIPEDGGDDGCGGGNDGGNDGNDGRDDEQRRAKDELYQTTAFDLWLSPSLCCKISCKKHFLIFCRVGVEFEQKFWGNISANFF